MTVKLLTEYNLEFLSLKGGCTCSSESTLVKMPHCWKSHITAHILILLLTQYLDQRPYQEKTCTLSRDMRFPTMCDQQSLRSACTYAQSDQSLCKEYNLEFLSLKGGCTGLSKCHIVGNHMSQLILSNIPWRQLFLQPWLCPTLPALMPYRYLCRQSFHLNQGHSPPFLASTWSQHDTVTGKYNKTLQNTCTHNDPTDRPYPTVETHERAV